MDLGLALTSALTHKRSPSVRATSIVTKVMHHGRELLVCHAYAQRLGNRLTEQEPSNVTGVRMSVNISLPTFVLISRSLLDN